MGAGSDLGLERADLRGLLWAVALAVQQLQVDLAELNRDGVVDPKLVDRGCVVDLRHADRGARVVTRGEKGLLQRGLESGAAREARRRLQ